MRPSDVTVVIPTLADAARREVLARAIDCVLAQQGVKAEAIVVINGDRYDSSWRWRLESLGGIRVLYHPRGNAPEARAVGVAHVDTEFVAFLDDDDLYTPDALAHRVELMRDDPSTDLVVTNYYVSKGGQCVDAHPDFTRLGDDPRNSIFEFPWLASLNGMFRMPSFTADDFRNDGKLMEWTALAIRTAGSKRIRFSDRPTATYMDTDDSLSKQREEIEAQVELMQSLNRMSYPPRTRRIIDRNYVGGLNQLACRYMAAGDQANAWRCHLRCLAAPGGLRYVAFTRKLLLAPGSAKAVRNVAR